MTIGRIYPGYPPDAVRWHGSCCVCAGRIVIPGDKRCAKCMIEWAEKQHELRRLGDIQKQIARESAEGQWFAGEEPDR